jgi:arsenate reductase
MSKATIWHNPRCSTSRKVLEALRERGVEPEIVLYLETPPSAAELKAVCKDAGIAPHELVRRKEPLFRELGLDDASEAALIKAMHENPILIERPVLKTKKGTRLCRPAEKFEEIL